MPDDECDKLATDNTDDTPALSGNSSLPVDPAVIGTAFINLLHLVMLAVSTSSLESSLESNKLLRSADSPFIPMNHMTMPTTSAETGVRAHNFTMPLTRKPKWYAVIRGRSIGVVESL